MTSQLFQFMLGVWLMAAPSVLGFEETATATNYRIIGPIVAAFAGVAVGECTRSMRLWNLPFALWLVISALILSNSMTACVHSIAAGVVMGALCCLRGHTVDRYGGGWMVLFRAPAPRAAADRSN